MSNMRTKDSDFTYEERLKMQLIYFWFVASCFKYIEKASWDTPSLQFSKTLFQVKSRPNIKIIAIRIGILFPQLALNFFRPENQPSTYVTILDPTLRFNRMGLCIFAKSWVDFLFKSRKWKFLQLTIQCFTLN